MLNSYVTQTQDLLQNPAAPNTLYSSVSVIQWINIGRGQLAGEAECVRFQGNLSITQGAFSYPFTSIVFPSPSSVSGVQGLVKIEAVWIQSDEGQVWIRPRPWPWWSLYELNSPVYEQPENQAQPKRWAQYAQGATGSLYVSPVPDQSYTAICDCTCYPIPLVDDTTVEAIPYLWTDAVPFYAAYRALLSAQSGARMAQAKEMFDQYTEYVNRARRFSTPSTLPGIYPQNPNVSRANQLGIAPQQGRGGGGG